VWYDSDDDRLTVSLATNTRLRKLRDTEDDDVVSGREYIQRLRRQYEKLHPPPEWLSHARKRRKMSNGPPDENEDSDVLMEDSDGLPAVKPLSEILCSVGSFTTTTAPKTGKRRKLRTEVIDVQRTRDVIASGPSSVDTLEFHPTYPLLLAGGPSQTLTLYHVSPQPPHPNPVLTSLHVKGSPLHTSAFCVSAENPSTDGNDATRVFFSARRRYFHTWSLATGTVSKITRPLNTFKHDQKTTENFKLSPCGRFMGLVSSSKKGGGSINVLSATSMQWVCSCRIDAGGGVSDFDWWRSGNGFAVVGKNGEVSEYHVIEKRVIARWWDEGSVGTTVLSIGGHDSRWIAIGSSSGIVNIYDRKAQVFNAMLTEKAREADANAQQAQSRPVPSRTLDHLTTPISHLVFAPDGQMLVMASKWKKDALRLVHLPSCTVYKNWPTDKTPLGRVSSIALGGKRGEWLAIGNEQGGIRLWEVRE
jgi:U3 small nucleolar RNA-associated protein 18